MSSKGSQSQYYESKPILNEAERLRLNHLCMKSNGEEHRLRRFRIPDVRGFKSDLKIAFGPSVSEKSDFEAKYDDTPEYHHVVFDAIKPIIEDIQTTVYHSFPLRIRKIWYEFVWGSDGKYCQRASRNTRSGWTCVIYANHCDHSNKRVEFYADFNSPLDFSRIPTHITPDAQEGDVVMFPSTWRSEQKPSFCDKRNRQLLIFVDFWGLDCDD